MEVIVLLVGIVLFTIGFIALGRIIAARIEDELEEGEDNDQS